MANLWLRVTQLDTFVNWTSGLATVGILDKLTSYTPPTYAMQYGTAVGEMVERGLFDWPEGEPYLIQGRTKVVVDTAILRAFGELYSGGLWAAAAFEVPGLYKLASGAHTLTLTGTADAISGLTLYEHKTTHKTPDYTDSLQWQVYLEMFQLPVVAYYIAEVTETARKFKEMHQQTFWRTPESTANVELACRMFIDWVTRNKFEGYFTTPSKKYLSLTTDGSLFD